MKHVSEPKASHFLASKTGSRFWRRNLRHSIRVLFAVLDVSHYAVCVCAGRSRMLVCAQKTGRKRADEDRRIKL